MSSIIIIGAGAAGLYAAGLLSGMHDITVLEAAPFAGGRIRTSYDNGIAHEGGAEFIHGSQEITMQLAEEAGLHWFPYSDAFFRNKGNGPEPSEMIEGLDYIVQKMKDSDDITLNDFLFRNKMNDLVREEVLQLSKGFSLADPASVSVNYLASDWNSLDEDQYFIEEGYEALVKHLLKKAAARSRLLYNSQVEKIEWKTGSVTIYTTSSKYEAEKVIITVPVNRIGRDPGISINLDENHRGALECFGYGPTIKCNLEFKEAFWQMQGFYTSSEKFATWWTHPRYNKMITGWMDEASAKEADTNEEALLQTALISLGNIFNLPPKYLQKQLSKKFFFNWKSGAYSFGKPGFAQARELFAQPIEETIYFAGEAFQNKVTGATVEAALVSAQNVVEPI